MRKPTPKIAVSVTPSEFDQLYSRRAFHTTPYSCVGALSFGMPSNQNISPHTHERLVELGLRAFIHTLEINTATPSQEDHIACVRRQAESLDALWLETDLGVWEWRGMYLGSQLQTPTFSRPDAAVSAEFVAALSTQLGRPFLIENPPVYHHVGDMSVLDYTALVAQLANTGIAIDLSHVVGLEVNSGGFALNLIESMPQPDRVREIHMTGYDIYNFGPESLWVDRHSKTLRPYDLALLSRALDRFCNVEFVTLEMEGASPFTKETNINLLNEVLAET